MMNGFLQSMVKQIKLLLRITTDLWLENFLKIHRLQWLCDLDTITLTINQLLEKLLIFICGIGGYFHISKLKLFSILLKKRPISFIV